MIVAVLAVALSGGEALAQRRPPAPPPKGQRPPAGKPPQKPARKDKPATKPLPANYVAWRSAAWTSLGFSVVGGGLAATGATLSLMGSEAEVAPTLTGIGVASWSVASIPLTMAGFSTGKALRDAGSGVGNGAGIAALGLEGVGAVFGVLALANLGEDEAATWAGIAVACTVPASALAGVQLLHNRQAVVSERWREPMVLTVAPALVGGDAGVVVAGRF